MEARNVSDVIVEYYIRNKKRLLKEAILNDNVQLSNKLIELYQSLGESLDDIFLYEDVIEAVAEKENVNLSEIFARKLR